jgi:hypothetical protein
MRANVTFPREQLEKQGAYHLGNPLLRFLCMSAIQLIGYRKAFCASATLIWPAIGSPLSSNAVLERICDHGRAERGDGLEQAETTPHLAEIKVIHFLKHGWRRI